MKAFAKMNNYDKGELLCRLFPEELDNLVHSIEEQCDYFLQNEKTFRDGWYQKGFFTAAFWYRLVQDAHEVISKSQKELCKRPRWFADQFFDGYNDLFTIYCLIKYARKIECDDKLRQAIHLLFGDDKLITIILNNNDNGKLV